MIKNISLHQQIKFKRSEQSSWESGNMYIQINSNIITIEDMNANQIDTNKIYDYQAVWYE